MPTQIIKAPIYQQLNEVLRDLIRSGEFAPDDQFLTERQISERFEVSRATANKALSNLVSEGIVAFKKGVGTFVRGGVLDYDLRSLVSFTDKALAAGKTPSTRVLDFQTPPAGDAPLDAAGHLRLADSDDVYYLERLRLADGVPMILETRCIAAKYCPGLTGEELAGSLYNLWTEKYRLDIAGADQTIRAVTVDDREATLLGVDPGAPGLLVSSLGTLSGGVPLWWEQTLYRGDAYEFQNRLGPIQTARPATPMLINL
jgi:GntR family transcriptional regulator